MSPLRKISLISKDVSLPQGWILKEFETVSSTMDEAQRFLEPKHVFWALRQTQGRGRQQRNWISELGNLYCSVIIDPHVSSQRWGELSFVSALAVGEALESFGIQNLKYKWPNDILIQNKKIAGILLEIQESPTLSDPLMIIGIGVNRDHHPEAASFPATCLHQERAGVMPELRTLLYRLIHALEKYLKLWQENGFLPIREQWLQKASFLKTKISVKNQSSLQIFQEEGIFEDIDESGRLLLNVANKGIKRFSTGDVFFSPS